MAQEDKKTTLEFADITALIPHRYPFLMIDRIEDVNGDDSAVGVKNVTINEEYFVGHFPGHPVMPGVLMIEAMAQTAATIVMNNLAADDRDKLVYFMTIDNARFRKPVGPGDTLRIHVEKQRSRGAVWKYAGTVKVGDTVVAEAQFSAMIVDK